MHAGLLFQMQSFFSLFSSRYPCNPCSVDREAKMADRHDAAALEAMSKKELVVLIQSVAPLELLQASSVR